MNINKLVIYFNYFWLNKTLNLRMKPLSDPFNDRQVNEVKAPPHKPLLEELMFPNTDNGKCHSIGCLVG